jgi:flavin reductase (DIM6/NTAB) family NADH-FMN oxidoreductase RutF
MKTDIEPTELAVRYRDAMASVCTPVSVVTTTETDMDGGATYFGSTVSAFSSLSLSPVQFIVALDNKSRLLHSLSIGSSIGLNILAGDQGALARHFATKLDDKFATVECVTMHPAPQLAHVSSWFLGTVVKMAAAGDHVVVVATVQEAAHTGKVPLLYWERRFTVPHALGVTT